jgi:hypothetical protein
MRSQSTDESHMIAYLLDQLTEAERARLEERYVDDDAFYEELKAVETELIDSYVRGGLSGNDRDRFEARYLASRQLRERIAFARELAAQTAERSAVTTPPAGLPWRWFPAGSWRASPAFATAVAAVLLVAAGSLIWRFSRPTDQLNPMQARHGAPASTPVQPEERDVANAPPAAQVPAATTPPPAPTAASDRLIALVLLPGSVRSTGEGAVLHVPEGGDVVRIRVDHEGPGCAVYRAIISTPEGQEVWARSALTRVDPRVTSVILAVPANALQPGDYILTLRGGSEAGALQDVGVYSFRVARR